MKLIYYSLCFIFLNTCSKDSSNQDSCRFLLDINVNSNINLSLPQYSQLPFAGNSVYIPNAGNAGIIVASTGSDFFAWDASDPNHTPNACSALTPNGLEGTCGCDDKNKYSLITGEAIGSSTLQCPLKRYRIEKNGNNLLIYNN